MAKKIKLPEKELDDFAKENAYRVFKDMVEVSHSVIEDFYADYTPQYYKRVYGFIGGGNFLYQPSIKKITNGYEVIFKYSSEFMTDYHRSDEWAFDSGFINGYHGGKFTFWGFPKETHQMSPSPWEIIQNHVNNYTNWKGWTR